MKAVYSNRGTYKNVTINKIGLGLEYSHESINGIWFRDCGTGVYFIAN